MRTWKVVVGLVVAAAPLVLAEACSESTAVTVATTGTSGGSSATGGSGGSSSGFAGSGGNLFGDAGCSLGGPCGDAGICTEQGCCDQDKACGTKCCGTEQLCSFQKCVTPGNICVDASDCKSDEYCEYGLGEPGDPGSGGAGGGCSGGVVLQTGRCLPRPPKCKDGEDPGDPPTCLQSCEYHPPVAQFNPEVKFAWGSIANVTDNVMMTPIVAQLDDDNCDNVIDERDIPEIIFTSYANSGYVATGTLRAISIVNEKVVEKWNVTGISAARQLAAGNIDGVPGTEVVGCDVDGVTLRAFKGDGSPLWSASAPLTCFQPSIANVDADPNPEIIIEGGIVDGVTGVVQATFSPAMVGTFLVADITGDGVLEVVSNTQAYHADGTQLLDTGGPAHAWTGGTHFNSGPAVADLDKDGKPEVIAVYFLQHQLAIWRYDANQASKVSFVRSGIDINGSLNPSLCGGGSAGNKWGGGPATVGDFNADGIPDVALAGGVGYAVFDGKKLTDQNVADADTFLWTKQTIDCSSAGTGSSLFDFDGDGKGEVVYADERYMRIYEGATGKVLFETCNTSGTLSEYPVIADVDNDGHADIVVASNNYSSFNCNGTKTTGIRVFGDTLGKWVRTRRTWNEHAYHVTNIAENGDVPVSEPANHLEPKLNNFRMNAQPQGEFAAPDLVVQMALQCGDEYGLVAHVQNIGEAAVQPGVVVGFYEGAPPSGTKLGEGLTTQTLYSLGSEAVVLPLATVPSGNVYAVVDDGNPPHPWHECREDNNISDPVSAECGAPN